MTQLQFDEYPFESRHAEINGNRYHYIDQGDGDVLLFVHGNPTWSFAWRRLIADLSDDNRCIAIDHLGCGLSDKPQDDTYRLANHIENLEHFIRQLDLSNITLVAHDWGGAIGMGTACRLPERFSRFVLMNTAAFRSKRIPLRIAVCRIPILGALALRGLNLFSLAALSMASAKRDRMTAAVRRGYLAPYNSWSNRIAVHRFVQDIPLKAGHPSYSTLQTIEEGLPQFADHPILLPWGMQDWCFTPQFLREFQTLFPRAEVREIDDAGHYVFEDAHEVLIPTIREFLGRHPLD